MHAHKLQWDIWHFTAGSAFVQMFDHRDSWLGQIVVRQGDTIAIPPGVSHGFYALEDCTLVYLLTREYDGTDEYGWLATDKTWPGVSAWPTNDPIISDRDREAVSLREFIEQW